MLYEVEVDTGLELGIITVEVDANNELEAEDLAITHCLDTYSKEYETARSITVDYKLKYRRIMRKILKKAGITL